MDLKPFGYASGAYACICSTCGRNHVADKKAWNCLQCAQIKEAEYMGLMVVPAVLRGDFNVESD